MAKCIHQVAIEDLSVPSQLFQNVLRHAVAPTLARDPQQFLVRNVTKAVGAQESGIRIVWLQWHVLTLDSEICALPHDFIIFLMGKVG